MIRNVGVLTLAFTASFLMATSASASVILAFVPSPGTSTGGAFTGTVGSPVSVPNSNISPALAVPGDNPGTPAPSPNFANLSASVTVLHNPIEGTLAIGDGGTLGFSDGPHEYFFTVTMTNNSILPFPIAQVVFELFNPAGAPLPAGYFASVDFDNPSDLLPTPTSSYQGVGTAAWTPHMITFGGLAGGGGEVPAGGVGTFTFSLDLPDGAPIGGNLGFRLTAHPEPTSLALAGLGTGLIGLVGYRRRQKKTG